MRNSLLMIANVLHLLRAQVSVKIANLSDGFCTMASDIRGIDPTDSQASHMFVGDTNFLYDMLHHSSCSRLLDCLNDFQNNAVKALSRTGVGILLAATTLLLYLMIAAPCACCRCCRKSPIWCCWSERRYPRNMGKKTKVFLLSTFLVYLGALAADVVFSLQYRLKLHNGSEWFLCEAFQFTDNVLNGHSSEDGSHVFLGLENVQSAIENVTQVVEANSSLLGSVVTIVDQTSPLTYALDEFLLYLDHMNKVVGDPQNLDVGSYECVFCRSCCNGRSDSTIESAISSISETVASSISQVRVLVQNALAGDTIDSLRSSLTFSEQAIEHVKSEVEDCIDSVLISNTGLYESIVKEIDSGTLGVVLASLGLPTLLLMIVIFVGVFRSHEKSLTDPGKKVRNPCFASCSWCITFPIAFVIFLIAGILGIGSYFVAASCDIVSSPDEFVTSALPRFTSICGFPTSSAATILSTCGTSTGSGDLLSVITASDTSNKTLREVLNISGPINAEFDRLSTIADSASAQARFATNPEIVSLLDALGTFGSLFTLKKSFIEGLSTNASLQVSTELLAAVGLSSINSLLEMAVTGIPDCGDRLNIAINDSSMSGSFEYIMGTNGNIVYNFWGLNSFISAIQAAGINIGTNGNACPLDYNNLTPPDVSLANPFHRLVADRTVVLSHMFRCDDLQVSPDPITGMATSLVVPKTCNFDQWVSYITSLHDILRAKAQTVDTIQESTIDRINTDLRTIVQTEVFPRIDYLLNSLDCKFVYDGYKDIVNAFCWKTVPGLIGSVLTLLGFGSLCLIAIIIEFVIWRHFRDNLSLWYTNTVFVENIRNYSTGHVSSTEGDFSTTRTGIQKRERQSVTTVEDLHVAPPVVSPTAEMQAGIGYGQFPYTLNQQY